mmetsp:Transcript_15413/g.23897  ORF Transcript_15413/g.23897 Transcript_15413/m.23897 type:complete len:91 (+) Transcript_15413:134-406(+)
MAYLWKDNLGMCESSQDSFLSGCWCWPIRCMHACMAVVDCADFFNDSKSHHMFLNFLASLANKYCIGPSRLNDLLMTTTCLQTMIRALYY